MKVAILADIHANLSAWIAVEAELDMMGVDITVVAGDIVGYYYWPSEVIERIMQRRNLYAIRGNHEDNLEKFRDKPCSRDLLRNKYGHGYDVALDTLTQQQWIWLERLQREAVVDLDGRRFLIRHSAETQATGYLYPDASSDAFMAAKEEAADVTIYAHTHHPFVWAGSNGSIVLNPGSIGQPRDIGGLASFVVYETSSGSCRFVRVEFEISSLLKGVQKYDPMLPDIGRVFCRRRL